MDALTDQAQQALLARLALAREKLDGFVHDLRAIDRELEDLATERKQHGLLHDVCGALEELREIGGAGLFWGDRAVVGTPEEHIRRARGRVDAFQKRLGEIEDRRQAVFEELERQQDVTDLLEDDVLEAQEEQERLEQEWIIEREISVLPSRGLIMPWARGGEEDRRYRRSLAVSLLYSLLFALVVPQIELPLRVEEEPIAVPERVVRLMEARSLPPAPRQEARPQPKEVPEEAPLVAEAPATKQKEGPGKGSGEGPGTGPAKGLLAFREKLSRLATNQPLARLGAQARITSSGPATGVIQRSMVTTLAPGSSGGINLAALSRGVATGGSGGGEFAGVQVARVASSIGGEGTGSAGGGAAKGTGSGGGPALGRTDEEIQIVFDRYKSSLYRLYNRELRNDPTLKGQVILRMRIEPDGSVSLCELQGTDMRAPQLIAQVVERVKTFDFGAKDVAAVTILYPIDFLPAV